MTRTTSEAQELLCTISLFNFVVLFSLGLWQSSSHLHHKCRFCVSLLLFILTNHSHCQIHLYTGKIIFFCNVVYIVFSFSRNSTAVINKQLPRLVPFINVTGSYIHESIRKFLFKNNQCFHHHNPFITSLVFVF